jgi:hypothetical protein
MLKNLQILDKNHLNQDLPVKTSSRTIELSSFDRVDSSGNIMSRTEITENSLDLSDLFAKRLCLVDGILAEDNDMNREEFRL